MPVVCCRGRYAHRSGNKSGNKFVALTTHRNDVARFAWVWFKLEAQAANVDRHQITVGTILITPDRMQNIFGSQDLIGIVNEMMQQTILTRGEGNHLPRRVDHRVADWIERKTLRWL